MIDPRKDFVYALHDFLSYLKANYGSSYPITKLALDSETFHQVVTELEIRQPGEIGRQFFNSGEYRICGIRIVCRDRDNF